MKFISQENLTYIWNKIKTRLDEKASVNDLNALTELVPNKYTTDGNNLLFQYTVTDEEGNETVTDLATVDMSDMILGGGYEWHNIGEDDYATYYFANEYRDQYAITNWEAALDVASPTDSGNALRRMFGYMNTLAMLGGSVFYENVIPNFIANAQALATAGVVSIGPTYKVRYNAVSKTKAYENDSYCVSMLYFSSSDTWFIARGSDALSAEHVISFNSDGTIISNTMKYADETLTYMDFPADAKTVGDKFNEVTEAIAEVNSKSALVVNITGTVDDGFTSDKTYEEVVAAYNAGSVVEAHCNNLIYPLTEIRSDESGSMALFTYADSVGDKGFVISPDVAEVGYFENNLGTVFQQIDDYNLTTTDKSIVGAINEVNEKASNLETFDVYVTNMVEDPGSANLTTSKVYIPTLDKTYDEIVAAYEAGKPVRILCGIEYIFGMITYASTPSHYVIFNAALVSDPIEALSFSSPILEGYVFQISISAGAILCYSSLMQTGNSDELTTEDKSIVGAINEVNEKASNVANADWAENDETAASYVQNRTHSKIVNPNKELINGTIVLEDISASIGSGSVSPGFLLDESTRLYDDVSYLYSYDFGDLEIGEIMKATRTLDDGTRIISRLNFVLTSGRVAVAIVYSSELGRYYIITYTNLSGLDVGDSITLSITDTRDYLYETLDVGYMPQQLGYSTDDHGQGVWVFGNRGDNSNEISTTTEAAVVIGNYGNIVSGSADIVVGVHNTVSTSRSGVIGEGHTVTGSLSFAHGAGNTISAMGAHAEGNDTIAASEFQHTEGKYNVEDASNVYAHIVGNGTSDTARSNAYTLDWSGTGWFAGGIRLGGTSMDDGRSVVLAPTSAAAGQLIAVKTVDENSVPTDYETVDGLTESEIDTIMGF